MDFTQFDSRSGGQIPSRLHLRNPANGAKLYDDDDNACCVLLYGTESPDVQAAVQKLRRQRLKSPGAKLKAAKDLKRGRPAPKGDPEDDDKTILDVHNELTETTLPLVAGFEFVGREGRELTTDPDDVRWFLNLQMLNGRSEDNQKSFLEQCLEHAGDRENYLGNGSPS